MTSRNIFHCALFFSLFVHVLTHSTLVFDSNMSANNLKNQIYQRFNDTTLYLSCFNGQIKQINYLQIKDDVKLRQDNNGGRRKKLFHVSMDMILFPIVALFLAR